MAFKRIAAIILAVVLLLGSGTGIMAQEYPDGGEMTPEHAQEQKEFEEEMAKRLIVRAWVYAVRVTPIFSINKQTGVATCSYNIGALNSINQINVYLYLQKLNQGKLLWENETSWSKSHYSFSATSSFNKTLTKTGQYRTKLTAYFYSKGTAVENVTTYSDVLIR
jgi:hypothetical protein